MRQVHLKFDLPYNWYAARKLGLYFDNLSKQLIMTGQNRTFKVNSDQQLLRIKLDFFKTKLIIPKGDEDVYVTIAMKGENSLGWVLNSFTRRGLIPTVVSKTEFDAFDQYYFKTTAPITDIDYVSFGLTAGVIAYLFYALFNTGVVSEGTSQLIWATAIIGVVTLLVILQDRKSVSRITYKSRLIVNSLLLFTVVTYLSLLGFLSLGWFVAIIPIAVFFRTLSFEKDSYIQLSN